MRYLALIMAMWLAVAAMPDAQAKRLAGGASIGKQSANVTPRQATPPATGAQPGQSAASPAGKPGPAAAAPSRPWAGLLGGVAAGLGLAWLASSLGLGDAFGQFLLVALLAALAMLAFGRLRRARLAYGGAPAAPDAAPRALRDYSPNNVGNDASARPWERTQQPLDAPPMSASGSIIGSALAGRPTWGIPEGFDSAGFLAASKTNFVRLQDAWDRADIPALRAMMTDEMIEQIQAQLAERESHTGAAANKTEVIKLEAQLLGIEELDALYMASVEFSGLIREDASAGPNPFREVWNITRHKSGPGGWLVAGVQALQ